ncbi:DUF3836 domain-containing protein [Bacteroides salyersiae]|uniref:DUF3836 domain-containing protein n=1 Tax=Bacteroides salyersiae TaxID=291644 RepID=UPI001C0392CE|nr:DUF3836 domain-containing protein [Bacteroides salyersiae]MBT9917189.1 DUF3836 domain-containing protein [Bacteroides salyersiae]
MKTNVFFKAVVMVVVVMAGEQLVVKTIYRNEDGHLFRHLRYTYTYDSENRVVCKEAAKWDSVKACWTPYFKLDVSYHSDAVEMNYALWNTKSNSFDKNMEKSTYDLNSGGMTRLLASAK